MVYYYHESTKLSQQDALALRSLASTGELPNNHYWNALRTQHDANATRFDKKHDYVTAALLDRDQLQRQGVLSAYSPLFSRTGFFAYAGAKHDLALARFDRYHPFLGRLFEITLPTAPTTAGEGLTPTPTPVVVIPPVQPPGSDNPPPESTTTGGPPTPLPPVSPNVVPEPASVILMSIALLGALVCVHFKRRSQRDAVVTSPQPVLA